MVGQCRISLPSLAHHGLHRTLHCRHGHHGLRKEIISSLFEAHNLSLDFSKDKRGGGGRLLVERCDT